MPVTLQPQYGPYDYEANGCDVEWREELLTAAVVLPVPRADVGRDSDGQLEGRVVTLRGMLAVAGGGDREAMRALEDAFYYAHRPGRRSLYKDTDRYLRNVQPENAVVGEWNGLAYAPVAVTLRTADPFYYATAAEPTDAWNAPATTNTRVLTNDGGYPTPPVFTLTINAGGTLALDLENQTTGAEFSLAGAVAGGDVLEVDCAAQTVKLNGANAMSMLASGTFWPLGLGANTVRVVFSGVTLTSIASVWTKRWL